VPLAFIWPLVALSARLPLGGLLLAFCAGTA
jgi:hypothetical protein